MTESLFSSPWLSYNEQNMRKVQLKVSHDMNYECQAGNDKDYATPIAFEEMRERKLWLDGQGDPQGDMQEIWIWPYERMVCAQPSSSPWKWHKLTPMGLWHTHIHIVSARRPDLIIINQKKKKFEFAKLSTLLSRLIIE